MRIEFRFNGASQVILTPENARDKQMLQLWIDGRPALRVKPTAGEEVIIEASGEDPLAKIAVAQSQRGMLGPLTSLGLLGGLDKRAHNAITAADTEAATSVGKDAAREVTDMGGRE